MLSLLKGWLTRYLIPIVLVAGIGIGTVTARWFYVPALERANERLATLQAGVAEWQKRAKAAQAAVAQAQREAAERTARLDAQIARLRRDLDARTYKDESCDDAAAAVREQWLAR